MEKLYLHAPEITTMGMYFFKVKWEEESQPRDSDDVIFPQPFPQIMFANAVFFEQVADLL